MRRGVVAAALGLAVAAAARGGEVVAGIERGARRIPARQQRLGTFGHLAKCLGGHNRRRLATRAGAAMAAMAAMAAVAAVAIGAGGGVRRRRAVLRTL
jgi:hypothetical protein